MSKPLLQWTICYARCRTYVIYNELFSIFRHKGTVLSRPFRQKQRSYMTEVGVGLLYAVRQGEIHMVILDYLSRNH